MLRSVRRIFSIGLLATAAVFFVDDGICAQAHAPARPAAPAPTIISLKVEPAFVPLVGPRARARLLVTAVWADGREQDVTDQATWTLSPPAPVEKRSDGALTPRKDGETTLKLTYGGKTVTAKVVVKDAARPTPVSFNNEVVPILTRAGCNAGSCHGAQYGKGGFKLSLAGFDTDLDYLNIVKQAKGRRIALADPAHSLFLLKPTMTVPHGGGRRMEPGSQEYRLLLQWLREGAHGPNAADPQVTQIDVLPSERILQKGGPTQRLIVRATYSDRTVRDVTSEARINTLNDAVAACTPEGVVTPVGKGQTAVMVRYAGLATVATLIVPFTQTGVSGFGVRSSNPEPRIDALVARKQKQLGLMPSPLCDDRAFIRRVSLDLIGTPPTPDEIKKFLADRSPNRRGKLVDALLARPEYADYWTLKWGDLLRSNSGPLGSKGMWSFTNWIRTQLQQNRPADQFVHDLILAQGSTFTNGPSNYYRVAQSPQDLAETTSQVFLGVRVQCARCHHHPFERWSQTDYYEFAAFFARIGLKEGKDFGLFGNEQVVRINDSGDVNHPKTGAVMYPTPLGVTLASLPDGKQPNPDANGDRRRALAAWLVSRNNRLFARNIANRYWGYMLGKGIVNPIDDQRVTNPPTNPALLDALADLFVKSNYDLKALLRAICTSQTYQRSSEATPENKQDELFFTHYLPKRLPAETLLDAIDYACGTREKFGGLPQGTRAIQLPDPNVGSEFLDTFGRPPRLVACECERMPEANLSQTLRLMNGELVNRKVGEKGGRLDKLLAAKRSDDIILNELYLTTLDRQPTRRERLQVLGVLAFSKDRKPVFEDVLLTLLNSKEFLFNH
jgi:hypothetical protein